MIDVAYVALGSNVGDRDAYLASARAAIAALPGTHVLATSAVEETDPIGPIAQDSFLNQMIAIETELSPHELLAELQAIERALGRERAVRRGPRTLDLDIILFEHQTVTEPTLRVPHPELGNRAFWQRELAELRDGAGGR